MPYIQKGETIDFLNPGPGAIAYDGIINLTTRIGIAGENIAVGAIGSVHVVGVFELPAINNAAFAVGDALYFDPVAGNITNVAAGNIPAGWAAEPKVLAGATVQVKIG